MVSKQFKCCEISPSIYVKSAHWFKSVKNIIQYLKMKKKLKNRKFSSVTKQIGG